MPWLLLRLLTTTRCGSSATSGAERRGRVLGAERAEALVDDDLPHAPAEPLDEIDQRGVREQAAVGVVGIDDHDRVGRVALHQRVELVEVDAEVRRGVELMRDERTVGELVVGRERRQADQQRPAGAGQQRMDHLTRAVADAHLISGHTEMVGEQRRDRRALGGIVRDHPLEPRAGRSRAAGSSRRSSRMGWRESRRRPSPARASPARIRPRSASGCPRPPSTRAALPPRHAHRAPRTRDPWPPARSIRDAHGSDWNRGRDTSCTDNCTSDQASGSSLSIGLS